MWTGLPSPPPWDQRRARAAVAGGEQTDSAPDPCKLRCPVLAGNRHASFSRLIALHLAEIVVIVVGIFIGGQLAYTCDVTLGKYSSEHLADRQLGCLGEQTQ